jgi:hypothetical protein
MVSGTGPQVAGTGRTEQHGNAVGAAFLWFIFNGYVKYTELRKAYVEQNILQI